MNVLITGGAGYIGSHVAWMLVDAGHDVTIVDDLSTGVRANVPKAAHFYHVRAGDAQEVGDMLDTHDIEAVMHFAGSIVVSESVEKPLMYYNNNVSEALRLTQACIDHGVRYMIFSSTAAVYGIPERQPIDEDTPLAPINPYGRSKLFVEQILADAHFAHDLGYVALRYFNVAGADPKGRTGQSTPKATHLIKIAAQAALGQRPCLHIFGTDYDTPDGTCIRDYIHVTDLARAHLFALDYLVEGGACGPMNCGYGVGFSVKEVIETVQQVSGHDFPVLEDARRSGDPPRLVADASLLRRRLGWAPKHDTLEEIVSSALAWEASISS